MANKPYKYGGEQYVGGQGRASVLDKNYYEDLGFSTTKKQAKETRGQLDQFYKDVGEREGEIKDYTGKVKTAKTDLDKKVKNAWKDYATSEVNLAGKIWRLPPEEASKLGNSLSKYWHMEEIHAPEWDGLDNIQTFKKGMALEDTMEMFQKNQKIVDEYANRNKSLFMRGWSPPRGRTIRKQTQDGVWHTTYAPPTADQIAKSKESHLRWKANKALELRRQGKSHQRRRTKRVVQVHHYQR